MKKTLRGMFAAALLAMAMAGTALAGQLPVVTGEHWLKSTQQEKMAFLLGAGTIISLEYHIQAGDPQTQTKSLVSSWVKGLEGYTLEAIAQDLDAFFAANPSTLNRPVVDVVWTELACPNLKKAGQPCLAVPAATPGQAGGK